MDIRYYRPKYEDYYFACNKSEIINGKGIDTVSVVKTDGEMFKLDSLIFTLGHFIDSPLYSRIKSPPDTFDIEQKYLNATDRPSIEGFKHPDVEPWS